MRLNELLDRLRNLFTEPDPELDPSILTKKKFLKILTDSQTIIGFSNLACYSKEFKENHKEDMIRQIKQPLIERGLHPEVQYYEKADFFDMKIYFDDKILNWENVPTDRFYVEFFCDYETGKISVTSMTGSSNISIPFQYAGTSERVSLDFRKREKVKHMK